MANGLSTLSNTFIKYFLCLLIFYVLGSQWWKKILEPTWN